MKFIIIFILISLNLFSIPYFSRKYEISCSKCHTIPPDLKKEGEKFILNGYKFKEEDIKKRDFPASIQGKAYYVLRDNFSQYNRPEHEFQFPYDIKLFSGDSISDTFSYYLSISYKKEKNIYCGYSSYNSDINDFYIQVNSPFKLPFNLRFGRLKISDQIFKSSLRLGEEEYFIYNYYGESAVGSNNIGYDEGIQFHFFLPFNLNFIAGIYNGNGSIPAGARSDSPYYPYFDADSRKNYTLRPYIDFGNFRAGLFYFNSKRKWYLSYTPEYPTSKVREVVDYFGPDFSYQSNKIKFRFQYLKRKDNLKVKPENSKEYSWTRGSFYELIWFPQDKISFGILYNTYEDKTYFYKINNFSVNFNYLLRENMRFIIEIIKFWYKRYDSWEENYKEASAGISIAI